MSKFAIVVTIKVEPGQVDEVLAELKAHAARCLSNEPGTLQFDVLVPVEGENQVMLYEAYVDEAAFGAHRKGESMTILQKGLEGRVSSTSGVSCIVQN